MRSFLPEDISVMSIELVPLSFILFQEVVSKTYCYKIWNHADSVDPFYRPFVWHIYFSLNLVKMREAANFFIGTHDFKSFCAVDSNAKTYTRKIVSIEIGIKNNLIEILVCGEGFLKQMVRNIVGLLVEVGRDRLEVSAVEKILLAKDRREAPATAPAQGLCLQEVHYRS